MTTRLAGRSTRFLPFNRGHQRRAGNPPNPDGHRTAYLSGEQIWARDNWLDLFARFIHVEKPSKGSKAPGTVIFPRFHQWDAVRSMEAAAKAEGAGQKYLVQHSAGSGKSNTIAWLAHRLSNLHDEGDQKVFDKVIVITDRVVLDRQLQDTIYQFEHAHGVVERIEDNSQQLADALAGGAGPDHHHHPAEVPLCAGQGGGAALPLLRRDRGRGPLLTDRRGGQRDEAGPRRAAIDAVDDEQEWAGRDR